MYALMIPRINEEANFIICSKKYFLRFSFIAVLRFDGSERFVSSKEVVSARTNGQNKQRCRTRHGKK